MVLNCGRGCPFQKILDVLGRRYALSVLWALQQQNPRRFNDLKRDIDVNPVTLSQRLGELENAGIIARTAYKEIPPRVEYALTAKGRDLIPLIENLEAWADKHEEAPTAAATA